MHIQLLLCCSTQRMLQDLCKCYLLLHMQAPAAHADEAVPNYCPASMAGALCRDG